MHHICKPQKKSLGSLGPCLHGRQVVKPCPGGGGGGAAACGPAGGGAGMPPGGPARGSGTAACGFGVAGAGLLRLVTTRSIIFMVLWCCSMLFRCICCTTLLRFAVASTPAASCWRPKTSIICWLLWAIVLSTVPIMLVNIGTTVSSVVGAAACSSGAMPSPRLMTWCSSWTGRQPCCCGHAEMGCARHFGVGRQPCCCAHLS